MSHTNGAAGGTQNDREQETEVVEWKPSQITTVMQIVLGAMMVMLGFFVFGLAYVLLSSTEERQAGSFNLVMVSILTAVVLVLHEGIHSAVASLLGGRPRFHFDVVQWVLPVISCRVVGQWFTRGQFLSFSLVPLVGISVLGLVAIASTPWGSWLIIPLAVNLGVSVGDVWVTWLALREPSGTLIEAQETGVRFYRPSPHW